MVRGNLGISVLSGHATTQRSAVLLPIESGACPGSITHDSPRGYEIFQKRWRGAAVKARTESTVAGHRGVDMLTSTHGRAPRYSHGNLSNRRLSTFIDQCPLPMAPSDTHFNQDDLRSQSTPRKCQCRTNRRRCGPSLRVSDSNQETLAEHGAEETTGHGTDQDDVTQHLSI